MSKVTLGEVIEQSKSSSVLGIDDSTQAGRAKIISYIKRALDLGSFETNYDPWIGLLDTQSDACGFVTLPSFIETVLAVNVGGLPSGFRDKWFEFHINGPGSSNWGMGLNSGWVGVGIGAYGVGNSMASSAWSDRMTSPTIQDIQQPSALACVCDNREDGEAGLKLTVQAICTSPTGYQQQAITTVGPDAPGTAIFVPLKWDARGFATSDPDTTLVNRIIQVQKPETKGYVTLYAVAPQQGARMMLLGHYGPKETLPQYKRMQVTAGRSWVRLMYRIKTPDFLYDYDIVPIESLEAMLSLIKAVRFRETNDYATGQAALAVAVDILNKIQSVRDGPGTVNLQVDPGWGGVAMDLR
jgi:hypothetical protein